MHLVNLVLSGAFFETWCQKIGLYDKHTSYGISSLTVLRIVPVSIQSCNSHSVVQSSHSKRSNQFYYHTLGTKLLWMYFSFTTFIIIVENNILKAYLKVSPVPLCLLKLSEKNTKKKVAESHRCLMDINGEHDLRVQHIYNNSNMLISPLKTKIILVSRKTVKS